MKRALTIEWAKRGEMIAAPSPFKLGETEPYMVLSRCQDESLLTMLFCEPCRVNLANVAQLEMHVEQGGRHRLAIWCDRHRVYEQATAPASLQAVAL